MGPSKAPVSFLLSAPTLVLFFLVLSLASAFPVQHHPHLHSRQAGSDFEDSGTDYTGYTLEGCQEVFGVCKGHLVHPGHVPGGKKQCTFELEKCNDTVKKATVAVVPVP